MPRNKSRFLLGNILMMALITGRADNPTTQPGSPREESTTLETVTVTASPLDSEELHLAQPAKVIRGDELSKKQAATLGETLFRELGVSATGFGLGASRPIIRGLGGSRVRMLEGGIGSMDISNLSDDHAVSIDPFQANQIEILKGPATLLYGSGAIGGAVNVVTDRIPTKHYQDPKGQFNFRYDAATSERTGSAKVNASIGKVSLHLDGLRRSTSNYTIPGFATLTPLPSERRGTLTSSDVDTTNFAGGASYLGDNGYLGFAVSYFASNYGIPGTGDRIDLNQMRYDVAGELYDPLPGFSLLKAKLGHNDYQHQELEANGDLGTLFNNDEYEGRIELSHNPWHGFHGVIGTQIQHRDFRATGPEALTPPVISRSAGVFLVEERDWNKWHFEFGGRYEHSQFDAQGNNPDVNYNLYSLSGGTVWNFVNGYSAGVSLTRAQRAPSIQELYNNGPHLAAQSFERGSTGLDNETANNLDFTLHKLDGNWTWRVNGYINYINNFIYGSNVDSNSDGMADRVSTGGVLLTDGTGLQLLQFTQKDALFYGAEAETTLGLFRSDKYGELDSRLFIDYVRGKLINGQNLPRITPLRFGGSLNYRYGSWEGNFGVIRVRRQRDTAPLETETTGYTLVEVGCGYTLGNKNRNLLLSLRGTNLLNEDIRYHTSFLKETAPQPGRSIMLTIKADF